MSSLDAVRARFARNEGLPFADILTESRIREVLDEYGVQYRNRVIQPGPRPSGAFWGRYSATIAVCRDTVSRIIAHRTANGMSRVLAQYSQLLQREESYSYKCSLHVGEADG